MSEKKTWHAPAAGLHTHAGSRARALTTAGLKKRLATAGLFLFGSAIPQSGESHFPPLGDVLGRAQRGHSDTQASYVQQALRPGGSPLAGALRVMPRTSPRRSLRSKRRCTELGRRRSTTSQSMPALGRSPSRWKRVQGSSCSVCATTGGDSTRRIPSRVTWACAPCASELPRSVGSLRSAARQGRGRR
jgi:hypothetical protein